jgi:hypothetical protein
MARNPDLEAVKLKREQVEQELGPVDPVAVFTSIDRSAKKGGSANFALKAF